MNELYEWKFIEEFPNYAISKCGKVFNMKHNRILTPYYKKQYLWVMISNENIKRKQFSVHRLVAQAFIPNIHNKPDINHIDGVKENNSMDNLEWVTHQENMQHARRILKSWSK